MTANSPPPRLRQRVLSSGGWSLARTAITATTQFATLIVLLRLLDTEDFGELSVVMVVLTLTQAFTQTGVDLALVRERGDISRYLNPFFSLQVMRGFALGAIVALFAWPMAIWQETPILAEYLLLASLVPVLEGFRGVSALTYLRNLEQKVPTIVEGTCAILSLISLTLLALWLRSPWAVLINQLFATGLRSFSYHLVGTRAHFSRNIKPLRPFFRFGLGYNMAQTSGTLIDTLDRLLIGRHLGLSTLGLYDRSVTLANYGLYLLPQFYSTVVAPAFAGLLNDRVQFWRVARKFLLWVSFAGAVLAGLVRIFDIVVLSLVAGDKGDDLLPFFRILLLCALLPGISWLATGMLDVLGRPQLRAVINGIHATVVVIGLAIVLPYGELWAACAVVAAGGGLSTILALFFLWQQVPKAGRPSPTDAAETPSRRERASSASS